MFDHIKGHLNAMKEVAGDLRSQRFVSSMEFAVGNIMEESGKFASQLIGLLVLKQGFGVVPNALNMLPMMSGFCTGKLFPYKCCGFFNHFCGCLHTIHSPIGGNQVCHCKIPLCEMRGVRSSSPNRDCR